MDNKLDKKVCDDLMGIQKSFFGDVLNSYFAPFKAVWLFVSIPLELVRHFIINMAMSEDEHEQYHSAKFESEIKEMAGSKIWKDVDELL